MAEVIREALARVAPLEEHTLDEMLLLHGVRNIAKFRQSFEGIPSGKADHLP